jgi:hypothetical protein
LNDWLLEQLPLIGIWGIAVPHTLHILSETGRLVHVPLLLESRTNLVLVENGVAHSGHEHHRDQEWNEGIVCHLVPLELADKSYSKC